MGHGDWKDMFRAVQANDLELVRYYVRAGIDLNYQHPEFMTTPLIECIRCGHLDMLKLLLELGASPHVRDAFTNETPQQVATSVKNTEALRILEQQAKQT